MRSGSAAVKGGGYIAVLVTAPLGFLRHVGARVALGDLMFYQTVGS